MVKVEHLFCVLESILSHTEHAEDVNKSLDSAKCKCSRELKAYPREPALCSSASKRAKQLCFLMKIDN